MKLSKENFIIVLLLPVLFLILVIGINMWKAEVAQGSVSYGSEYHGTTTRSFNGTAIGSPAILNTGVGVLGSVVITGAAAGQINIYDATSTITNLETGTTTLATIPLSAAANTYTFDRIYTRGLVVEIIGTTPTSTITWR